MFGINELQIWQNQIPCVPLFSGFATHVNLFFVYHKPDMRTVVFLWKVCIWKKKQDKLHIYDAPKKKPYIESRQYNYANIFWRSQIAAHEL